MIGSPTRVRFITVRFVVMAAAALFSAGVAANARARTPVDRDVVADCESGQDWMADTGNGYYGGLRFSADTWSAHGGVGLPHQFPRAEQIRIAETVLSAQGLGPWSACTTGFPLAEAVPAAASSPQPVEDETKSPLRPAPCGFPLEAASAAQESRLSPNTVGDLGMAHD